MAGTVYLASLIPATQFFVLELQATFGDKLAITTWSLGRFIIQIAELLHTGITGHVMADSG